MSNFCQDNSSPVVYYSHNMTENYFRTEEEVLPWLEKVNQHILNPDSQETFEIPGEFQTKKEQWRLFRFLKEGLGDDSGPQNIILVGPRNAKVQTSIEFQVGEGTPRIGMYIPYPGLELKPGARGNRSVLLSAKDLSRVRSDEVLNTGIE